MKIKIPLALWLCWASMTAMQAATPTMRPYKIDLPRHVLRFSLPEEIAREMNPAEVEQWFDPQDASFIKNGFREIAGTLYDLKGPFWVGAYGSLKFHVMVQKKMPEYADDISNMENLESYVRWKIGRGMNALGCDIARSTLNGAPAVRRHWNTFVDPSDTEPEDLEIFSFPLDDGMFLDFGFNVMAWESGRKNERKWKPKAEALREAIKATIALEPRTRAPKANQ